MGAHAASLGDRLFRPRRARQFVHQLRDGCATTVYVATYPRRLTHLQTVQLEPAQPLREWARMSAVGEALAGGFETGIADGRHPRAALGLSRDRYIALVCDGYSLRDSGLTRDELAALMAELGAETTTDLGGGASASLVSGGHLHNRPRDDSGVALLYGRPVASAIVFAFGR
jgi:phosphodiester glycosidase